MASRERKTAWMTHVRESTTNVLIRNVVSIIGGLVDLPSIVNRKLQLSAT